MNPSAGINHGARRGGPAGGGVQSGQPQERTVRAVVLNQVPVNEGNSQAVPVPRGAGPVGRLEEGGKVDRQQRVCCFRRERFNGALVPVISYQGMPTLAASASESNV